MSWGSWQAFWAMGGYGLYVWGSVGVVFALIGLEVLGLVARRRGALRAVAQARQLKEAGNASRARVAARASQGAP
ncbi:heme exporter protein CcmD [Aquabacterium soli]|uniref:Heme exporter protein D n=1 Tax=Aquabacterium soli TaxID=2493092 RepID=A0A3R8S5Z6_9BURK|nr:heme exporter protein CcmD [Aquabacterium soli]RRS03179.1 heme exporter protein CcmD [Aquabacterium soli]